MDAQWGAPLAPYGTGESRGSGGGSWTSCWFAGVDSRPATSGLPTPAVATSHGPSHTARGWRVRSLVATRAPVFLVRSVPLRCRLASLLFLLSSSALSVSPASRLRASCLARFLSLPSPRVPLLSPPRLSVRCVSLPSAFPLPLCVAPRFPRLRSFFCGGFGCARPPAAPAASRV